MLFFFIIIVYHFSLFLPLYLLSFIFQIYYFFSLEFCIAVKHPNAFLITWINARLALHFIILFGLQLMLIVRQSTMHYVSLFKFFCFILFFIFYLSHFFFFYSILIFLFNFNFSYFFRFDNYHSAV